MSESFLMAEKQAYRDAAKGYDYFVSGVSTALLIAAAYLSSKIETFSVESALDLSAIVLFSISLIAGLRKMEQTVMVLGTSCTLLETQLNAGAVQPDGVGEELNLALEVVSHRAARTHRLRNWSLILGVVAFILANAASTIPMGM